MTPECLIKMKGIVSDQTYDKLEEAVKQSDNKMWDLTMEETHADMQYLQRQAILDTRIKVDIVSYINEQGLKGIDPAKALSDYVSGSGARQLSGRVSIDKYIEGVRGGYLAGLADMIHATRPKFLGLNRSRDNEFARNLVKNIYGDADAGGAGKGLDKMADAWKKTTQDILERFNKAGGSITKIEDFNIGINHYSPHILKAGEDQWVKDASRLFDLRKLPDTTLSDEELLRKMYVNITREGQTTLDYHELGIRQHKKMGNAHQEHRWLQPKNGDAWLEYTEKYGRHSSPIDAMIEYVDGMSTQIGLMENLGTNPPKLMDDMVDHIRKTTGNKQAGALARSSLDQIMSKNPGYESGVTEVLRGLRNFQTASKLGMAPITALSDTVYSAVTSLYNGMPAIKLFVRHLKNLNPANNADRLLAGKMGLTLDYAMSRSAVLNRYSDINGYGYLYRAADVTTRASGLNHWTNTAKMSFGLEFLSTMGDYASKPFKKMPKGLRRAFERYGITEDEWASIGKAITTDRKVTYIDPSKIADDKLSAQIVGMVKEETNFAVPEPNAKARAVATLGIPTNTVGNEFIKVGTQFKTFGVSVLMSHMGRALDKGVPLPTRMGYGMSTLIGSTLIGIAIVQLKDIAKGRTPREMSPGLALEGFLQGGSTGVLGDMTLSDPTMFGGTPAYLAGPTAGDIGKLMKVMHLAPDKAKAVAKNWEKELKKTGGQVAAGAAGLPAKLWWTRVAMERLLIDAVKRETDPKFHSKIRDQRKWLKKERKQGYWWKPGQTQPEFTK